jgi:hypothetical protein
MFSLADGRMITNAVDSRLGSTAVHEIEGLSL